MRVRSYLFDVRFGKEVVADGRHSVRVVPEALVRVAVHEHEDLVLRLPNEGRHTSRPASQIRVTAVFRG